MRDSLEESSQNVASTSKVEEIKPSMSKERINVSEKTSSMTQPPINQEAADASSASISRQGVDNGEEISLRSIGANQSVEDGHQENQSDAPSRTSSTAAFLPPVDGGRDAWTFVVVAFIIELCTWGFVSPLDC